MSILARLAVKYLIYKLKKDKNFWYSWQSNIAMCIYDNYKKFHPITDKLYEFCNNTADDFLNNLTEYKTELQKSKK